MARLRPPAALLLIALLALAPRPARADVTRLSTDFSSIMQWLSSQLVSPLAFNAGDTFPCPLLTQPGRGQLELTAGGGLVPLDTGSFPTLRTQALNDMGLSSEFPGHIPVPDLTATIRYGLPWESDLAVRFSNVTTPRFNITSKMAVSGQTNNFGLQYRKFLHYGRRNAVSLTGYYQYLRGTYHFFNSFNNVLIDGDGSPSSTNIYLNSQNAGSINWNLQAAGVNLVFSRQYGNMVPFAGLGINQASGSLEGKLQSQSATYDPSVVEGSASSRPRASSMRGLFGLHVRRDQGWDYFFSGEMLATPADFGKAINLHAGVMFPIHFGAARREAAKKPVRYDVRRAYDAPRASEKLVQNENQLIFIH